MRFFVLFSVLSCIFVGCARGDDANSRNASEPRLWLGTNFSPRGWPSEIEPAAGTQYFQSHGPQGAYGNLIGYYGSWRDPGGESGQPTQLANMAQMAKQQFGAEAALGFGWWDERHGPNLTSTSEPDNNTWSNTRTRDEFRRMVVEYCQTHQPRFVYLGNETNFYYVSLRLPAEQSQWDDWVSHFVECYDAIKAVSPQTIVFTVFQLEKMRGLGARAGWKHAPHWHLISDFGTRLDAVGFTTYPHVEFGSPAEVPANYYTDIAEHWSGPVIFTEISWPADPANPPYAGSDAKQSDWIERFFDLTANVDVLYVNHAFLHDPPEGTLNVAFGAAGLRNNDGSVIRPADATWQRMVRAKR